MLVIGLCDAVTSEGCCEEVIMTKGSAISYSYGEESQALMDAVESMSKEVGHSPNVLTSIY